MSAAATAASSFFMFPTSESTAHSMSKQHYTLLSQCLDDLECQFEWHWMEQYLIFDQLINAGLMKPQQQKMQWYWFHQYTSPISTSSFRQNPSPLIKLNNNKPLTLKPNAVNDPSIIQLATLHPPINHPMESWEWRVILSTLWTTMRLDVEDVMKRDTISLTAQGILVR